MGLFSRKPKDDSPKNAKKAPAVDLHAELDAVKQRLAASEQARADLETRLRLLDDFNSTLNGRIAALDGANAQLDTRLGALDQGVARMGEQLVTLSSSTARLDRRLEAVDDLDVRLRELTDRLNTPMSAPPPAPTPPPPPSASISPPPPPPGEPDERLDELASQLDTLAAAVEAHTEQMGAAQVRLAEIDELTALTEAYDDDALTAEIATLREQLAAITERMSSVDARVTSVSMELANQLTELSRDIDELNRRSADERTGDETTDTAEIEARLTERLDAAIDDVLDTTEKLAAEQARYEIQFRADLAELAERLRRPSAS